MVGTVTRLPSGTLRISRVVYMTNLLHSDSREIPLGVVAEITLDGFQGIGAAFSPEVSIDDLDGVGPIAKKLVSDPMAGLWPKIEQTFDDAPAGQALNELCRQFSSSLSFLAPRPISMPRKWLRPRAIEKIEHMLRLEIPRLLEEEYFKTLFPSLGDAEPHIEELLKKVA